LLGAAVVAVQLAAELACAEPKTRVPAASSPTVPAVLNAFSFLIDVLSVLDSTCSLDLAPWERARWVRSRQLHQLHQLY
jgi:hypothetical protein